MTIIEKKYNIIVGAALGTYNILNINEQQLGIVVDAYLMGKPGFTLAGKKYSLNDFREISIFEYSGDRDLEQLNSYLLGNVHFTKRSIPFGKFIPAEVMNSQFENVTSKFIGDLEFGTKQVYEPPIGSKDEIVVFYSWQSDLKEENRFISKALSKVQMELKKQGVLIRIDRDTRGEGGAASIPETIFSKIDGADIFIGDVNIVGESAAGRQLPNPNVLIELGFAGKSRGWDRIIMVMNNSLNTVESLPIDIRHRVIQRYDISDLNRFVKDLKNRIQILIGKK